MKHVDTTAEVFCVATGASSAILTSQENRSHSETEITLSSLFLLAVGDIAGWQGVKVFTRPSILCVTHQMMNYKWYLMLLGQYMTILAGTWSV